jgi:hypothetical protein
MTVGGLLNAVIRAVVHHNYPNLSLSFDNMEILCPVILVSGLAATILWYLGQRLLRDYPASPLHDTATHDPLFSKSETPPNSLLVASLLFVFSLVAGLASAGNPGPYLYLISFLYVPFQLLNFPDNQFFSNFRIGFLFGSLIAIPAALPVILYNWGYASWWSWLKSNVFLLICSIPIGSLPLVVVFYNVNLSMGLQGWPHFSDPYSIASFILSALIPSVLWYLMQSRKLRSTKAGK